MDMIHTDTPTHPGSQSPAAQESSPAPPRVPFRTLTRRELGILQMFAEGMSNKRIAQSLGIAPETVKSHAKNIFIKMASRTRAQAAARARAIGILYDEG
jgi:LuxR family maltose regulon positive regulatory protein